MPDGNGVFQSPSCFFGDTVVGSCRWGCLKMYARWTSLFSPEDKTIRLNHLCPLFVGEFIVFDGWVYNHV